MPKTEAKESCRLTEAMLMGFAKRIMSSERARPVRPSSSRPSRKAVMTSSCMTQALTTAGVQPAMSVKSMTTGIPHAEALRRPTRRVIAEQRKPRCIPETDTMCATPVTESAASSSASS